LAKPLDAASVEVAIPESSKNDVMSFISTLENFSFNPGRIAKVIINEKTGTIVAGSGVTIGEVAVSQGSITVTVKTEKQVSQPAPRSKGETQVTEKDTAFVTEEKPEMVVLQKTSNVGDLAKALNSIGASPRDIMAIFQAIKKAGGLNAELVIM